MGFEMVLRPRPYPGKTCSEDLPDQPSSNSTLLCHLNRNRVSLYSSKLHTDQIRQYCHIIFHYRTCQQEYSKVASIKQRTKQTCISTMTAQVMPTIYRFCSISFFNLFRQPWSHTIQLYYNTCTAKSIPSRIKWLLIPHVDKCNTHK